MTMVAMMLGFQTQETDTSTNQKKVLHFTRVSSCKDTMPAFLPVVAVEGEVSLNLNAISTKTEASPEDSKTPARDITKV
jgi:hypothetical protein